MLGARDDFSELLAHTRRAHRGKGKMQNNKMYRIGDTATVVQG